MKPAQFEYFAPRDVTEVIAALNEYGDDAKLLAGGQSLIPLINMRLARPKVIIDLNQVDELSYLREEEDRVIIGAVTRHADIENSSLIRAKVPLLAKGVRLIGHFQIRNRGTIGGSLAHADPSAELPTVVTALEAKIEVTGPDGTVMYSPEDFFLGYLTTPLGPGEILTKVVFPGIQAGEKVGCAFIELARRYGDLAIVSAGCQVKLKQDGTVESLCLALGGVGPVPYKARGVEDLFRGATINDELLEEAGQMVESEVDPESDMHASASYRRKMAGVYTVQAIRSALEDAERGDRVIE